MGGAVTPPKHVLPTPPVPEDLPKITFANENARLVFYKRYVRKNVAGEPAETPEETFWRVAYHVAKAEAEFGADDAQIIEQAKDFYRLLADRLFFPNSPTWTGAGTPLGQLAACFTADMRVVTRDGLKRIVDVQVGDLVLTHKGRYRPVIETMQRRYTGPLYHIRVKGIGVTLEVTPEHPILTPNGWVEAQHLQEGDWVAVGMPQGIQTTSVFDLASLEYAPDLEVEVTESEIRARKPAQYQRSGRLSRWIPRFVRLTPELARLCGYYVAEGTIDPDERYVRFTLGTDEQEIQKDIIELIDSLFGIEPTVIPSSHGRWVQVDVYNRVLATWFRTHFGKGSTQKSLPQWLLYAPPEVQRAFLVGLFRGDGLFVEYAYAVPHRSRTHVNRSLRLTLANPSLIQQVWQILLRLGYDANIRPVDTRYVTPNASDTAQVSLPPLSSRDLVQEAFHINLPAPDSRYVRKHVLRQNGEVFFKIARIEVVPYQGIVYNLEVEEDHTYVTEGVVVHNCFVLPISDDMGRKDSGIFMTLRNAALIQQTGGGNGFSFSRLRPRNTIVKSSAGKATGPVGFLRVYDKAFGEIAQGGSRRGANMAVLRVDHPDIEDFITCKTDEDAITNFNISVGVTDAFMRAVENDEEWELVFPDVLAPEYETFDGTLEDAREQGVPIKVYRKVRARELFDKIVRQAHHNGEPGLLFLDTANRDNPVPHQYRLEATNPCGEQWLGPYENCCLGSINLAQHATPEGGVDWDKLRRTVERAVRFLDDVVQANAYVPAVPQLKEAAHRNRRIGLGIKGLADLMYRNRVRYGSPEAQDFAAQIMEFIRYHAMRTSIALARERGPFPGIKGSIYDPQNLKWKPPVWPDWLGGGPRLDLQRPALDWDALVRALKQYGIRNAAQMTVAPTGTISTVSGVEGYGCEPVFALAYYRYVNDEDGQRIRLRYVSPLFMQALDETDLDADAKEAVIQHVLEYGTIQNYPGELPAWLRDTFVVAQDVSAEEHVRMQAALQVFVDNAISKTINFPASATPDDVAQAFMLAWKLGIKGLTVYVTGSRETVVLETQATAKEKGHDESAAAEATATTPALASRGAPSPTPQEEAAVTQPQLWPEYKKPRPEVLKGFTFQVNTPLGKAFVTINENGGDQPFEVFINTAKAGSETAAISEAIGRLISYILRLSSPVKPIERLEEVIRQLRGIGGDRPLGFGPYRIRSLPDGVGYALEKYLLAYQERMQAATNGQEASKATLEPTMPSLPLSVGPDEANGGATQAAPETPKVFAGSAQLCPECGQATLVLEEGCAKCYSCGYSEC